MTTAMCILIDELRSAGKSRMNCPMLMDKLLGKMPYGGKEIRDFEREIEQEIKERSGKLHMELYEEDITIPYAEIIRKLSPEKLRRAAIRKAEKDGFVKSGIRDYEEMIPEYHWRELIKEIISKMKTYDVEISTSNHNLKECVEAFDDESALFFAHPHIRMDQYTARVTARGSDETREYHVMRIYK